MTALSELWPTQKLRLMDLVTEAGVDVSDWKNVKGGAQRAHVNPKYCYEWSFVQPRKVVVLNLWHSQLRGARRHDRKRFQYATGSSVSRRARSAGGLATARTEDGRRNPHGVY